jgi:hypothetical protein
MGYQQIRLHTDFKNANLILVKSAPKQKPKKVKEKLVFWTKLIGDPKPVL